MNYIALLRGINVGGNRTVTMGSLKNLFEGLGYSNVSTYINSGNVFFNSKDSRETVSKKVMSALKKMYGFEIPTLIKTEREIRAIVAAIPDNWKNDSEQRTDVAYLFPDADNKSVIKSLPLKDDYIDIRYVKGAVYWNLKKTNIYKSHLSDLVSHKLYQSMTIRNVNTARRLARANGNS